MKIAIFLIFIFHYIAAFAVVNRHKVVSLVELKGSLLPAETETDAEKIKRNSDTLYIFDFDNTLMAMQQELGSDQWYNWQSELIQKNDKKYAVAKTKGELFDIQYKLFALGKMRPVEPETAQIVKSLQKNGYKVIILTSRGSEYRTDTEKELTSLDLNFIDSAIGPRGGILEPYLPDLISNPRLVTYQNGILMGSGQDKGLLIRDLLEKTGYKPNKIIFIDDTPKNITNVDKEFDKSELQVHVVQYDAELKNVKKFEKDKSKVIRHWKLLKPVFDHYNKVER